MGIALSLAHWWTPIAMRSRPFRSTACTFSRSIPRVKNDYVESVSDKKLIEQAIGGMVSALIRSIFLDESAFKDLRQRPPESSAVSASRSVLGWFIKVIAIDETPAARAGIRAAT